MNTKKFFVKRGDKFNRLTIIREVDLIDEQRAVLCKCNCGNRKVIRLYNVVDGSTKSCAKCIGRRFVEIGTKINMLTFVKELPMKKFRRMILCKCDCGNKTKLSLSDFLHGKIKSCGCLTSKRTIERNLKHGKSRSPEYSVWIGMRDRCNNPNNAAYKNYGGRGIRVCKRWRESFRAFYDDMGKRPSLRHTLDRINNDGNYESTNCRWIYMKEQQNNRRSNRLIIYDDKTMTLAQWSRELDIPYSVIINRINNYGWSIEKSFTTPIFRHKTIRFNGKNLTLHQWAKELKINYPALLNRIRKNWPIEKAFTVPLVLGRNQYSK